MKTFRFLRRSIKLLGLRGGVHLACIRLRAQRLSSIYPKILLGMGSVAAIIATAALCSYGHRPIFLANMNNHTFNKPITIAFSRLVRGDLRVKWRENVAGSWNIERSVGGVREVTFTPEGSFTPGAVLHADFTNVEPLIDVVSGTQKQQEVAVVIEQTPALVAQVPVKDATGVQVASSLTLRLAHTNHGLRKLVLKGDIPTEEVPTSTDDITFVWKLTKPLEQGRHYQAAIIDQNRPQDKQTVGGYQFDTVSAPRPATSFSGFIAAGSTVTIDFDKDMKQQPALIDNAVPGSGVWHSARQYVLTVGDVEPGKTYMLTFKKGLTANDGGVLTDDVPFSFSTPGHVTVTAAQPSGSRVAVQSAVKLTFDQTVNHDSAEKSFAINPHVDGSFSWSGNILIYTPIGLQYQTVYTVSLAAGVTPVFGLPSEAYSMSFTTTYETVKLAVPQYYQMHRLSCEESSLRMALALYGITTTDDEVLGKVGYAPQARDTTTNTWQDPNEMFVGDVDGSESTTGWGAYAVPIAKAARTYGRDADVLLNPSVQQVSAAVHAGHPVVVWGIIGASVMDDSWNTATSGVVHAAKNAHVRVVYGVDGSADSPLTFYIHDPLKAYGSLTWSAAKLQANMDAGGQQAVIVW